MIKRVNCKNLENNDLRGPFKLQKLKEKERVLIQGLKVNERQKYDQENDIILCKKEPDLSPKERTEVEMAITTEKLKDLERVYIRGLGKIPLLSSMTNSKTPPVAITLGDPAGIGPRIIFETCSTLISQNRNFFLSNC